MIFSSTYPSVPGTEQCGEGCFLVVELAGAGVAFRFAEFEGIQIPFVSDCDNDRIAAEEHRVGLNKVHNPFLDLFT